MQFHRNNMGRGRKLSAMKHAQVIRLHSTGHSNRHMCCQLTCRCSKIQNCMIQDRDSGSIYNVRPRAGSPGFRTVHHDYYLLRGAQIRPCQTAARLCVNWQNDYGVVATPQPVQNSYLFLLYSLRFSHIIGFCCFHHITHQQIPQYQNNYISTNK